MTSSGKTTQSLDPVLADRLLDLLASDDDYRKLFQGDPAQALTNIGYQPPTFGAMDTAMGFQSANLATPTMSLAGCMQVNQLASKDAIGAARDELRSMLTSAIGQNPPSLDISPSIKS